MTAFPGRIIASLLFKKPWLKESTWDRTDDGQDKKEDQYVNWIQLSRRLFTSNLVVRALVFLAKTQQIGPIIRRTKCNISNKMDIIVLAMSTPGYENSCYEPRM